MAFITSKWFITSIVIVITLFAILYMLGKKSVQSEVLIAAPPDRVWSVLIDTENYAHWNEVFVLTKGELKEDSTVTYRFYQDADNSYEISTKVKRVIARELLNQGGGMPGILTFDHRYVLESVEGGTKVTIREDYRGIGVLFWNPSAVGAAYERLIESLRQRTVQVLSND